MCKHPITLTVQEVDYESAGHKLIAECPAFTGYIPAENEYFSIDETRYVVLFRDYSFNADLTLQSVTLIVDLASD